MPRPWPLALAPLLLAAPALLAPWPARAAQPVYVPAEVRRAGGASGPGRWSGSVGVSASGTFTSNENVVGQVDGASYLVGVGVNAAAAYVIGRYETRSTLSVNEAWSRTPALEEFIKTNDVLETETLHNYFLHPLGGLFGRAMLRTSALPTRDVRAEVADYIVRDSAGAPTGQTLRGQEIELNAAFEPLTLTESIGVFAEPLTGKALTLSLRAGAGARQTFADGALIVDNQDGTPEIELTALEDVYQVGVESFAGARGEAGAGRIAYVAGLTALLPIANNDPEGRSAFELVRAALEASLTVRATEWLQLVYTATVISDPQLVEEIQVQNSVVVTLQYTLLEKRPEEPAPGPTELELATERARAAEARAEAAEAEAEAARARAEAAERRLIEGARPETESGPPEP